MRRTHAPMGTVGSGVHRIHHFSLEVSSSITPLICRIIFHFPSPARCPLTTIVGVGVVINILLARLQWTVIVLLHNHAEVSSHSRPQLHHTPARNTNGTPASEDHNKRIEPLPHSGEDTRIPSLSGQQSFVFSFENVQSPC